VLHKVKLTALLIGAMGVTLMLSGLSAIPASADSCQPNGCYAIMNANAAQDAVGTDIMQECLGAPTGVGEFINWELWLVMNGGPYWVEGGMTYGYLDTNTHGNNFSWFWADSRPNGGGYHEHFISAGSGKGQWANISIYHAGGGSWSVQKAGEQVGESTNNETSAYDSQAGAETKLSTNNINAFNNNFQYRHTGGGWAGAPVGFAALDAPFGGKSYPGSVTGAASQVWANKCTPSRPGTSSEPRRAPSLSAIVQTARRMAALNGEPHPTGISYVMTTRAKANSLFDATVDSNQSVYLVQLRGHFNGAIASKPHGDPAPKGTVLTVTIDSSTGQLTDWGISDRAAPLDQLGAVHYVS
jgi:hypothetical protein